MEKAIVQAPKSRPQSGFTLVELVIGSAAFLVILTSAVMMLTQWMKATGESDRAIEATDQGAKAISQIANDIRMATYLYHYATVSIEANAGQPFANFGVQTLPIVTQTDNDADLPATRQKAYFAAKGTSELMGVTSAGARNVLAMISDQPYGISKPRYIVYWLDDSAAEKAKNQIVRYRADGVEEKYYLLPLYRLEASPSANVDATPKGWYTFGDKLTDAGTSSLYIKLATKKLAESPFPAPKEIDIGIKVTKVADAVMGPGISELFTLRNPHPYSNASMMSPYLATVSIRTTGVKVGGFLKRRAEIFELNTRAFARNIPLPQNSAQ